MLCFNSLPQATQQEKPPLCDERLHGQASGGRIHPSRKATASSRGAIGTELPQLQSSSDSKPLLTLSSKLVTKHAATPWAGTRWAVEHGEADVPKTAPN